MLKPSEIIRMAMNHPSYLNNEYYLCQIIANNLELAYDEQESVMESIESSLNGYYALESYLMKIQGIYSGVESPEYRQAAFAHWNALIEKLEKEGK